MKILFKALRLDGKGWVRGSYIAPHAGCDAHVISCENGFGHEVDGGTVCQYTGKEDKNKEIIFGGDTLSYLGIVKINVATGREIPTEEFKIFECRISDCGETEIRETDGSYDKERPTRWVQFTSVTSKYYTITGNIHDTEASDD